MSKRLGGIIDCKDKNSFMFVVVCWLPKFHGFKAVVNTVGSLLASRRVFCWLPLLLFFLVDKKIRLKHLLKHANKKNLARIAALQWTNNL